MSLAPIHSKDAGDPFFDPIYAAERTMIAFLQALFAQIPASSHIWTPDPNTTGIFIAGTTPITTELLSFRPAVIVGTEQIQFMNTTLHSMERITNKTGNVTYRDVLNGSYTVNCISRVGVEARRLAWFIAFHVKALRTMLQRTGRFAQIGQEIIIMAEQPPGALLQDSAEGAAVNVPISLPFVLMHSWEVREPSFVHDQTRVLLEVGAGPALTHLVADEV
jgi:hypothetical protein